MLRKRKVHRKVLESREKCSNQEEIFGRAQKQIQKLSTFKALFKFAVSVEILKYF